jgi:hypothetical protein
MSSLIRLIGFGVFIVLLEAPTIFSQEQPGLKVGESAPSFMLKDQEGSDRSLDELIKKGPVALVFYRSADW